MQNPQGSQPNKPLPKKRGRPLKVRDPIYSGDDGEFTLSTTSQENTRRIARSSSQNRSYRISDSDSSSSDDENSNPGPLIDEIVAGSPFGKIGQHIIKEPAKSYIKMKSIDDPIIQSGKRSYPFLARYSKLISKCSMLFEVQSPLGVNLSQPATKLLDFNNFVIERIISHKSDEELQHIIPQKIDLANYRSGLPIDGNYDLSDLLKYTQPMRGVDEQPALFIKDDGSYFLGTDDQNPTEENPQIEEEEDFLDEPPPKTQYFIKWKGLPIEKSTWETQESLMSDKFCAMNIDEISSLIRTYWRKYKKLTSMTETNNDAALLIRDREIDSSNLFPLEKGFVLNQEQIKATQEILEIRKSAESSGLILSCQENSGRIGVICEFLSTIRFVIENKRPSLILCHALLIPVYEEAFRLLTQLKYTSLTSSKNDRDIVKTYEIIGKTSARFEVMIADVSVLRQESVDLNQIKFDTVVIDTRFSVPVSTIDEIYSNFKIIVTSDSSIQYNNYPIVQLQYFPFRYKETLFIEPNLSKPIMNSFITDLLKSSPKRYSIMPMVVELFQTCLTALSHPYLAFPLISYLDRFYETKYNKSMRTMTERDKVNFLSEFSGKFVRLNHLLQENKGLTIIFANDLATLHLLSQFLSALYFNVVIINSYVKEDRPTLDFQYQEGTNLVVLSLRNLYSPFFTNPTTHPKLVIFFDLPGCLKQDLEIAQFFLRAYPNEAYEPEQVSLNEPTSEQVPEQEHVAEQEQENTNEESQEQKEKSDNENAETNENDNDHQEQETEEKEIKSDSNPIPYDSDEYETKPEEDSEEQEEDDEEDHETTVKVLHMKIYERPKIIRLLTKDSMETVIYSQMLSYPALNLSNLSLDDCEILFRAVTLTSKPGRRPPKSPSEITFIYPDQAESIKSEVDKGVYDFVKSENNFWEEIYPSPNGVPLKSCNWLNSQAQQLIDEMMFFDYGNWASICEKVSHSEEETREFGRAIMLQHIMHITPNELSNYALVLYICQLEYFETPYDQEALPDLYKYWSEVAMSDPLVPSTIFVSKGMQKVFLNISRLLQSIHKVWIVRTYFHLHPEPTLPIRCVCKEIYNPVFVYRAIQKYLLKEVPATEYPEITYPEYEVIMRIVYSAMETEVYIKCADLINQGATDITDHYLRPIFLSFLHGPHFKGWPTNEIQESINWLTKIGIPKFPDGTPNWTLFGAIAQIRNKSPQMITTFMNAIYKMICDASKSHSAITIPDEISLMEPIRRQFRGRTEIIRTTILADAVIRCSRILDTLEHIRTILTKGISRYMPQQMMPNDWNSQCDEALLSGIFQYGYDFRAMIPIIAFKPFDPSYPDFMMKIPLNGFQGVLSPDIINRRVTYLILCFADLDRKISFSFSPIKRFFFIKKSNHEIEVENKRLYKEYQNLVFDIEVENFMKEHPDFQEYLDKKQAEIDAKESQKSRKFSPPGKKKRQKREGFPKPEGFIPDEQKVPKQPKPKIKREKKDLFAFEYDLGPDDESESEDKRDKSFRNERRGRKRYVDSDSDEPNERDIVVYHRRVPPKKEGNSNMTTRNVLKVKISKQGKASSKRLKSIEEESEEEESVAEEQQQTEQEEEFDEEYPPAFYTKKQHTTAGFHLHLSLPFDRIPFEHQKYPSNEFAAFTYGQSYLKAKSAEQTSISLKLNTIASQEMKERLKQEAVSKPKRDIVYVDAPISDSEESPDDKTDRAFHGWRSKTRNKQEEEIIPSKNSRKQTKVSPKQNSKAKKVILYRDDDEIENESETIDHSDKAYHSRSVKNDYGSRVTLRSSRKSVQTTSPPPASKQRSNKQRIIEEEVEEKPKQKPNQKRSSSSRNSRQNKKQIEEEEEEVEEEINEDEVEEKPKQKSNQKRSSSSRNSKQNKKQIEEEIPQKTNQKSNSKRSSSRNSKKQQKQIEEEEEIEEKPIQKSNQKRSSSSSSRNSKQNKKQIIKEEQEEEKPRQKSNQKRSNSSAKQNNKQIIEEETSKSNSSRNKSSQKAKNQKIKVAENSEDEEKEQKSKNSKNSKKSSKKEDPIENSKKQKNSSRSKSVAVTKNSKKADKKEETKSKSRSSSINKNAKSKNSKQKVQIVVLHEDESLKKKNSKTKTKEEIKQTKSSKGRKETPPMKGKKEEHVDNSKWRKLTSKKSNRKK